MDVRLDELIGYQLRRAQLHAFARFAEAMNGEPLTPLVAGLLLLVEAEPGANQGELADRLGADPSTMVRLVDQLERAGHLTRVALPTDRRHTVPTLTPDGRRFLARIKPRIEASERAITDRLTQAQRSQLIGLLRKLNGT
ncbi:MAG: MarR family winged helix-turn-helix transcriptional regulator [Vulcanimicrobiaceae bacterium]